MSIESRRRQRGVTMIELIMFMVIIGVALAGIVVIMNFTTQHSADPVRRKQALMLAEALLEEVELAKFSFCDVSDPNAGEENPANPNLAQCAATPEGWGPEPGNQRPFDNVNDYVPGPNVATEAFGVGGKLVDANGNALPLSGFLASVTIRPEALGGIDAAEVLRITVTVNYDGQSLSLDGYRTRYAPNSL